MKTLGQSSNFIIQIDETKYTATEQQDLTNLVNSVYLTGFETDYNTLCGWYGVATNKILGLTNKAVVTFGNQASGAGSTSGYSPTGIWIKISTLIGGNDHRLSTFAHEMNHIMEGYKKNWTVTNSQGEGLCRAVADLLHPLPGSDEVNAWLAFDPTTDPTSAKADTEFRKDWVSVSFNGGELKAGGWVNGMDDSYSIGCAILFIFYLKNQLGFSMNEICQSAGDTLESKYKNLSHAAISGFSQFKRLLDVHFPGVNFKCTPNNPFPLVFTLIPLASAGRKNNLFIFAKMLDGRIIFNQAAPGQAFVGWQEVPGGQKTDVALAAGMQNETLFVFAKKPGGSIIFNQAAAGGAFVGWQEMPGNIITNVPLAAAGRKNNLFVFAKTMDGRIIFNQAAPGKAFVGWQEVPGGKRTDVALAAGMQKETLFVFAKTPEGSIIFNQAAPGGAFVGWQEMPGNIITNMPLASAGRKNNLFVFAKTPEGKIIFNQAVPGKAVVGWQEVPGGKRTDVALAAGMQKETLFVFAKTPEGSIIFNQAAPGGAFVGWQLMR